MPVNGFTYVGSELELFAGAAVWKEYLRRRITPYLGSDVLEVGAGLGGTTRLLCRGDRRRWVCLEPDPSLSRQIEKAVGEGALPPYCSVVVGTLDQIAPAPPFDTLLYIDVLEHIEDDGGELARAAEFLTPGGHVVVLSPAHDWLFTAFDKAIGHYRRYTRPSLRAVAPKELEPVRLEYLDSVGLLASLANRLMLRQSMPTPRQIAVWDRGMVRVSRWLDPLLRYNLGKSVLGVFRRVGSV
jgi:hypothetical protein